MRPRNKRALEFVAVAVPTMAALYALLYVEHAPGSLVSRALSGHLVAVAQVSGWVIRRFDPTLVVQGNNLGGRFPLSIVLDCAALDVQAIYASAVAAFPVPWRERVVGGVGGIVGLWVLNILRIVALYFIGLVAPRWFHTMDEEVFQLVMVLGACGFFAVWALSTSDRRGTPPPPVLPAREPSVAPD